MTLLVSADSRMPRTSTTVSSMTIRNAGMLKPKCQPGAYSMLPCRSVRPPGRYAGEIQRSAGCQPNQLKCRSHVRGEADAHRHVADRIFQDEVPADDPRDQLAHGRVGVGVGAAGDGNHRRQFGVAQRGEAADDRHQHQRQRQRRAGAGPSQGGRVMHDVVGQRRVEDGRGVELLPGNGGTDHGKDAGADDRADAQGGQRPRPERLLQPMFRLLRFGDQLVNGLAREELARQGAAPGSIGINGF